MESLLRAESVDELWQVFSRILVDLGYRHAFYASHRFADMPRMWLAEDTEWYTSYPPDFVSATVQNGCQHVSPWTNWSRQNSGARPANWILTEEGAPYMTPGCERVLELCSEYGVLAGHVISLRGISVRINGTIGLNPFRGATQDEANALWDEIGTQVTALCAFLHLRINALPRMHGPGALTTRQREVVEWVAYGKTVSEIAEILGVTPATVEKHLRLAREALGVGTTAQAILKAHVKNQIFVKDPGND